MEGDEKGEKSNKNEKKTAMEKWKKKQKKIDNKKSNEGMDISWPEEKRR